MRVAFTRVLLALLLFAFAGPARAEDPQCMSGDLDCVPIGKGAPSTGTAVDALLPQGIIAIGPKTGTDASSLYLFFDGNDSNLLDGYLGISAADLDRSLLGLVGNSTGNFDRQGTNAPVTEWLSVVRPGTIDTNALGVVVPNLQFLDGSQLGALALPDLQGDVLSTLLPSVMP